MKYLLINQLDSLSASDSESDTQHSLSARCHLPIRSGIYLPLGSVGMMRIHSVMQAFPTALCPVSLLNECPCLLVVLQSKKNSSDASIMLSD